MSTNDDTRPGKMTDTQLDQLLATANRELLDHIEATADADRALTAIMTGSTQEIPPSETAAPAISDDPNKAPATVMIRMRIQARDLARDFDLVCRLAHALDLAACRLLDFTDDIALNYARGLVGAQSVGLSRALGLARDRAIVLARDLDPASARTSAQALGLAFDLADGQARDLGRDLLDRAGDLGLDRVRARAQALALYLDFARDRGLAHDLVCALGAQHVDASGADLSDMEIRHLDALDGIVWTRQTTWPPRIANQVEEHSEEIRPCVYQVRLGNTSDHHVLTPV